MIRAKIDNIFFEDVENQDITISISNEGYDTDIGTARLFSDARDYLLSLINAHDVFRLIPFQLFYNNIVIFNGYITFRENHNLATPCDYIEVSLIKDDSNRSLELLSDSITVVGGIISGDIPTIQVPYQLSSIPDKDGVAIALTSIFLTGYILQQAIKELVEHITLTISNPFTINAVLLIIIHVSYVILLLVALINYIVDVIHALIPDVNNTPSYNLLSAINGLSNKIGYTVTGNLLDDIGNYHIIPPRGVNGEIIDNYTLRDLIDIAKKITNCNIIVRGNTIFFEGKNTQAVPSIIISEYELNNKYIDLSESPSILQLRFLYDSSDKNTVNNGVGNSCQLVYNRHGDARIIELPLSRAKRKDELLRIETILKKIFSIIQPAINTIVSSLNGAIAAINRMIAFFNKIKNALAKVRIKFNIDFKPIPKITAPNLSDSIEGRIGNLLVESDTWGVPKLAFISNSKISANNSQEINAENIINKYYLPNYVYEVIEIRTPYCIDILNNNGYASIDGISYEILSINYNVNANIASMKLRRILFQDLSNFEKILN